MARTKEVLISNILDATRKSAWIPEEALERIRQNTEELQAVLNKRPRKVYEQIASSFAAYLNCLNADNYEWLDKHLATINQTVKKYLPSGSGFDKGTSFDFDASTPERLVFHSGIHHMDDMGGYDGWSHFKIIVTPSLQYGINVKLQSVGTFHRKYADRGDNDYILEVFAYALVAEIPEA